MGLSLWILAGMLAGLGDGLLSHPTSIVFSPTLDWLQRLVLLPSLGGLIGAALGTTLRTAIRAIRRRLDRSASDRSRPPGARSVAILGTTSSRLVKANIVGALFGIATLLSPTLPTSSAPSSDERVQQVLLIGLDAADWHILSPMMRRGELPNLARLVRDGHSDFLRTLQPMISPAIWTSLATSRTPKEHGIHHFAFKPLDSYDLVEYRGAHRKVRAIWDVVSAAGQSVSVLDYMAAAPAEPVAGVMISDLHSRTKPSVFPPGWLSTIDDGCLVPTTQGKPRGDLSAAEHADDLNTRLERTRRLALCLLEQQSFDLSVIYTHTTDAVQHLFWKYAFPNEFSPEYWDLTEVEDSGLDGVLSQHWQDVDRMVGEIVARAAPSTLTLVVSDHGATASPIPRDALRAEKLLAMMGWLALDSEGRIDRSRTLAYDATAVPRNPAISLNLGGREPEGVIDGKAFEPLRSALIEDLSAIETRDGDRFFVAVEAVRAKPDANDPGTHSARDIRCVLNDELFKPQLADVEILVPRLAADPVGEPAAIVRGERQIVTARVQDLLKPVSYSGKHRELGVFIAHGPGIRRGTPRIFPDSTLKDIALGLGRRLRLVASKPDPTLSILDITPTVLWTLGLPVARDMAGTPATELFTEDYVEAHPIAWIDSYEEGGEQRPIAPREEIEIDAERLRYLRALGYVN